MERSAAQVGRLAPYQATKCLSLHVIDQNLHVIDQNLHVHVRDLFRWPYKRVPSRVTRQASKH